MYFTLEINEQLASAMRAAAEFKVEVEKIIESAGADEETPIADDKKKYEEMSDDICEMMCKIGHTIGNMITEMALDEVRKVNPRNNLNPESYVSE
ncbi:hypothetical protein J8L04_16985 [Bacteroides fragilis]|jgi:hypothetical protein|uniref:Uncharacterized protein n=1 Tax=Bacteroides fragilis TaxID=817 RepID=A0A0I9SB93_BACFG|nr:hypothetical protein [Bacteroides fragilis]MCM0228811.1 hypothetical protein [Bacteroides fragilis]QCQ50796.1 hypothetical protein EE52_016060 [Bacteroides fragilis]